MVGFRVIYESFIVNLFIPDNHWSTLDIGESSVVNGWQKNSKLVTLDNVPFLFSGINILKYDIVSGIFSDKEGEGGMMCYPRSDHTVVSVPEDWLCSGEMPTTSETSTPLTTKPLTSSLTSSTTTAPTTSDTCDRQGKR